MKEKKDNKLVLGDKTKSPKKAELLYFLLPNAFRNEVKLLLNKNERENLEKARYSLKQDFKKHNKKQNYKNANKEFYQKKISPLLPALILEYKKQSAFYKKFNYRFRNFPWWLAAIHFLIVVYSLLLNDFFLASSFAVYGVLSTWVLLSQEPAYWFSQIQIFNRNFSHAFVENFLAIIFTLLTVIVLIVTVGMLSVNEAVQENKNIALLVLAVFSAPVTEELIFRDLFYRAFHTATNFPFNALALSSFLFALAHFQTDDTLVVFAVYWFAGMLLSLLRFFFGSLLYPLLAHSLANLALFFI